MADPMRAALEALTAALDGGHEWPDATYSIARRFGVNQSELEAEFDSDLGNIDYAEEAI